jgi:dihydrofolate reductase
VANLIYSAITSLDGFIEDEDGSFDWAAPDEEVHGFINDLERPAGTHLYGRRMYETMLVWETDPSLAADSPLMQDFALVWQAADKIVYSRTLAAVSTRRTRLERDFDPQAVRQLKAASGHELLIGGPELAAQAFRAGLVDEMHLFIVPILVGNGKRALPAGLRLELELMDERRFVSGVVFLRYRVR